MFDTDYFFLFFCVFSFFSSNEEQNVAASLAGGILDSSFSQLFAFCIVILCKPSASLYLQNVIWSHSVSTFGFLFFFSLASLFSFHLFVLGYVYTVNLCWHVCIHQRHEELVCPADQAA